jgi:hypothetical protein
MGLNVGVRHKNTTLPKCLLYQMKTNTDRIQFGLNVGVRRIKSALQGQLIFGRDIFMSTMLQMKSIYKK